ncbi:MAG TPA: four helix bundle protein [Patescibacteria group bacterium]|nr:four helix bundle protein [Patescibacteria group bacterium]
MINNKGQGRIYDLEERTAKFGEKVIDFVKNIPINEITKRIIPQLVAAGTSVGSSYCEADCAKSNKDFIHKMCIANKEAKEAKHYIRMISRACPEYANDGRKIWQEGHELNLIFTTIIKKAKETEVKKNL